MAHNNNNPATLLRHWADEMYRIAGEHTWEDGAVLERFADDMLAAAEEMESEVLRLRWESYGDKPWGACLVGEGVGLHHPIAYAYSDGDWSTWMPGGGAVMIDGGKVGGDMNSAREAVIAALRNCPAFPPFVIEEVADE